MKICSNFFENQTINPTFARQNLNVYKNLYLYTSEKLTELRWKIYCTYYRFSVW